MKQHKKFIIFLLLVPALLLSVFMYYNNKNYEKIKPEIKEGILDLEGWDKKRCPSFQLSGEWEICPGELLSIEEINNNHEKSSIVYLPFSSGKVDIYGRNLSASDAATFRIHIVNSPTGISLAFRIRQLTADYRFYVDNQLIAKNGDMGGGSAATISQYLYNTVRFIPQNTSYDIIVQIADQYDTKGLLHWPVEIGDYDALAKYNHIVFVISYLTVGAIIILILFLFVFWLNMPEEKELLLICIFGITTLIRILINQDILIPDILPNLSVLTLANLDYSAAFAIQYLAPASILAIYRDLYPRQKMTVLLVYTLILIAWAWVAPASMYSDLPIIFDFIMVLIFIYTAIVLSHAAGEGRPGSGILLVTMSCMVALMLISFGVTDRYLIYYLLSGSGLGFCLIIFIQCYLMAKRLKEAMHLELSALKGQIRPHFIHNALATIIAISRTDSDRSRDLLVDFSSYLRGTFDYTNVDFISIEQELELVKAYFALEKARFGDKYKVLYRIEAENFLVPPLILQPLVENALVHGLRGKEEGGTVTVYILRKNKVVRIGVKDDGLGTSIESIQGKERKGISLDNINRRLRKLYGSQLQYNTPKDGGFEVYLEIPYREVIADERNTG